MERSARATNKENRRQCILSAARATLARDGVDGLTVRKLAGEAGVTVPTIYNLIGNKEALLRRLLDELVSRAEEALSTVESDDPIEATAREPTNRPDTYERFPKPRRFLNCEQQPAHTKGPRLRLARCER